jgi:hypothetical protein
MSTRDQGIVRDVRVAIARSHWWGIDLWSPNHLVLASMLNGL